MVAPTGLVRKSAMLELVETHLRMILCSRTASFTKKKFRSRLFMRPFDVLSSEIKTAARLSHLIIDDGCLSRDFRMGIRNNRKSTEEPSEMNSAAQVDVATTFWRLEPHATGLP